MSDLISVKAELVRDHLVEELVAEAYERFPGEPPEGLSDEIVGSIAALGVGEDTRAPAEKVARLGYLGRLIECERFEPAREAMPWLTALLERGDDETSMRRWQRHLAVSLELARVEPDDRPDPANDVASWRVPGPGGHVRHYVAMESVARELRQLPDSASRSPSAAARGDVKRCWMLGFFARCCEESAPRERSASPAPRR